MRLGSTFYFKTPLEGLIIRLLSSDNFVKAKGKKVKGQRNLKFYMDYLENSKKINNHKFIFIHLMLKL